MAPIPLKLSAVSLTLFVLLTAFGCEEDPTAGGALIPPLSVGTVTPETILTGTTLQIAGGGFIGEVASYDVRFDGFVDGTRLQVTSTAVPSTDGRLEVLIEAALLAPVRADEGLFVGDIIVTRTLSDALLAPDGSDAGRRIQTATRSVRLTLARVLAPTLSGFPQTVVFPGDLLVFEGDGFLLGSEGTTLLRFDGEVRRDGGPDPIERIVGLVVPSEALPTSDPAENPRARTGFRLTPDVFGIRPGYFVGSVDAFNVFAGSEVEAPAPAPIAVPSLRLSRPFVTQLTPESISRGQRLTVIGRGFLPADGLLQSATILRLDGVFDPDRGQAVAYTGTDALVLYPDEIADNVGFSSALRPTTDDTGRLRGLGVTPGQFDGTATPVLLWGSETVEGTSVDVALTIGSTRQVVYIRTLPSFTEALIVFGLLANRPEVLDRISEVLARDYAGYNIVFDYLPPDDFAEFAVVEVGGTDPNGSGLFGLDNTEGKDVGNLRLDDVIGGFNAETRSQNFAAYGGIFVTELMALSPSVGDVPHPLASQRFDDIFGAVSPRLGGSAAIAGQVEAFDDRGAAIRRAIRVLGNLIGSTITHEVGHSLGLTAIDGRVHNIGDNPGWIMDSGVFRPFAERAEIDGMGPAVFSPDNQAYLREILGQ
ncbi:MAG: hypothetical protein ACI9MR_001329 [Myxococcota bacterium]|jgi:hypothetical protein